MEAADVVIAGAGIVGLSLALELAASGLRVSVFERGRANGRVLLGRRRHARRS